MKVFQDDWRISTQNHAGWKEVELREIEDAGIWGEENKYLHSEGIRGSRDSPQVTRLHFMDTIGSRK